MDGRKQLEKHDKSRKATRTTRNNTDEIPVEPLRKLTAAAGPKNRVPGHTRPVPVSTSLFSQ